MPSNNDYNDERHKKEEIERREKRKVNYFWSRSFDNMVNFWWPHNLFPVGKSHVCFTLLKACFRFFLSLHPLSKRMQNCKNQKHSGRKRGKEKSMRKRFSRNTGANERSKRQPQNQRRLRFRNFLMKGPRGLILNSNSKMLPLDLRWVLSLSVRLSTTNYGR